MAEAGIPDQESETMQGVFVPAGTPQDIVDLLNREIVKAMQSPGRAGEMRRTRLRRRRQYAPDFAVYIKKEIDKWHKVIIDAKIPQDSVSTSPAMRIVDIRETSVRLNSTLANSSIDFSEMTTSVVAVITDVKRDGKPVMRLRVQFDRTLCLRRADARALHSAHPQSAAAIAAQRGGR